MQICAIISGDFDIKWDENVFYNFKLNEKIHDLDESKVDVPDETIKPLALDDIASQIISEFEKTTYNTKHNIIDVTSNNNKKISLYLATGYITNNNIKYNNNNISFLLFNGNIYSNTLCKKNSSEDLLDYLLRGINNEIPFQVLLNRFINQGCVCDEGTFLNHCVYISFKTIPSVPFSLIFYDSKNKKLWFAKDRYGRRSLLIKKFTSKFNNNICISSYDLCKSINKGNTIEISPSIFCIDLYNKNENIKSYSYDDIGIDHKLFDTNIESLLLLHLHNSIFFRLSEEIKDYHNSIIKNYINKDFRMNNNKSYVSLLFSGGLDSIVLAALLHITTNITIVIELINICYFCDNNNNEELSPDRITSINGLIELKKNYPNRDFRLVFINLNIDMITPYVDNILNCISPNNTVMDFNIGTVLFFGSKGNGILVEPIDWIDSDLARYKDNENTVNNSNKKYNVISDYQCQSSICFSGLGPDEMMGGYGRHRTVFKNYGVDGLKKELNRDFNRLPYRNLGRDTRISSASGVEIVFPYLDENVVSFIKSLDIENICNLELPLGIGDKQILRNIARILGINKASTLQKRAIQFGTRIANRKVAGYIPLDHTMDIFQCFRNENKINPHFCKKNNKKNGKPNFS